MADPRRLRSKHLRYLLYRQADGRCSICRRELPPDWHADHVVPYRATGRTRVGEMQALCPECNLRKGAKMADLFTPPFRLRPFQRRFLTICDEICRGSPVRSVIAAVTPGGGKSNLPVILAAKLIPTVVDKICWVVPRKNLQDQAQRAFQDGDLRAALGHSLQIRASTNDDNPAQKMAGFATTMQAVAAARPDSALHREFRVRRYALVIDEVHHVWEGGEWHRALAPLVEAARIVLYMTGSHSRHDTRKIAFLPYTNEPEPKLDLSGQSADWPVVRYTRAAALEDRAIVRVQFFRGDSKAEWTDRNGEVQAVESFDEAEGRLTEALYTALSTDYAFTLLDKAVAEWCQWRERVYPAAKLLVVAPTIPLAKQYLEHVRRGGHRVGIATTDDGKEAQENIKRFRSGDLSALVTVAMAYEGLDVPAATHLACLTHVRSYPWIEQVIARVTRFDRQAGDWESQYAFAYVPDDPLMREIIEKIKAEEVQAVRAAAPDPDAVVGSGGDVPPPGDLPQIVPHASAMHSPRVSGMGDEDIPPELVELVDRAKRETGVVGSHLQIVQLVRMLGSLTTDARPAGTGAALCVTPSEREQAMRTRIQKRCNAIDFVRKADHGTTNRELRGRFGKPREQMSLDELAAVWRHLNTNPAYQGA